MTRTNDSHEIPSSGDRIDRHIDLATDHATRAVAALTDLENTAVQDRRGTLLNQQIGVHVKLAGVHADLALALAHSTRPAPPTTPMDSYERGRRAMLLAGPDAVYV